MKYYKLKKNLPTFKAGDLFILDNNGNLHHSPGGKYVDIMAYHRRTLEAFPNVLSEWFEEIPEPERDGETKKAFAKYLAEHKDERFFQAVRNFAKEYIDHDANFVFVSKHSLEDYIRHYDKFYDTFHWECDDMLKKKEEDDELSDEEQRADEY